MRTIKSIVRNHLINDARIDQLVQEGRKKKSNQKTQEPEQQKVDEVKEHDITYSGNFNKNIAKLTKNSKKSDLNKIQNALEQLKNTGRVVDIGGIHAIGQPIYSEVTQTNIEGWKVIPISRANEIRLAYKNHGEGKVEVKFGRPSDIGYKH